MVDKELLPLPTTTSPVVAMSSWTIWNSPRLVQDRQKASVPSFVLGDVVSLKNTPSDKHSTYVVTGSNQMNRSYHLTDIKHAMKYNREVVPESMLRNENDFFFQHPTCMQFISHPGEKQSKRKQADEAILVDVNPISTTHPPPPPPPPPRLASLMGLYNFELYFIGSLPNTYEPFQLMMCPDECMLAMDSYEWWTSILQQGCVPILAYVVQHHVLTDVEFKEYKQRRTASPSSYTYTSSASSYPHLLQFGAAKTMTRFLLQGFLLLTEWTKDIPLVLYRMSSYKHVAGRNKKKGGGGGVVDVYERERERLVLEPIYCFWNLSDKIPFQRSWKTDDVMREDVKDTVEQYTLCCTNKGLASSSPPLLPTAHQWDKMFWFYARESMASPKRELLRFEPGYAAKQWDQQSTTTAAAFQLCPSIWHHEILGFHQFQQGGGGGGGGGSWPRCGLVVSESSIGGQIPESWMHYLAWQAHVRTRSNTHTLILANEAELSSWLVAAQTCLHGPGVRFHSMTHVPLSQCGLFQKIVLGEYLGEYEDDMEAAHHDVYLLTRKQVLCAETHPAVRTFLEHPQWTRVILEFGSSSMPQTSFFMQQLRRFAPSTSRWVCMQSNLSVQAHMDVWASILWIWGWPESCIESLQSWMHKYAITELTKRQQSHLEVFVGNMLRTSCVCYTDTYPFPVHFVKPGDEQTYRRTALLPIRRMIELSMNSDREIFAYDQVALFFKQKYLEFQRTNQQHRPQTRQQAAERKSGIDQHQQQRAQINVRKHKLGETNALPLDQLCRVWLANVNCGTEKTIQELKTEYRDYKSMVSNYLVDSTQSATDCYREYTGCKYFDFVNKISAEQPQCIICYDLFTMPMVTECGHLFCHKCIVESIETSPAGRSCPACRFDFPDNAPLSAFLFRPPMEQYQQIVKLSSSSSTSGSDPRVVEDEEPNSKKQKTRAGQDAASSPSSTNKALVFHSKINWVLKTAIGAARQQTGQTLLIVSQYPQVLDEIKTRCAAASVRQNSLPIHTYSPDDLSWKKSIAAFLQADQIRLLLWPTCSDLIPQGIAGRVDQVCLLEPCFNLRTWKYLYTLFQSFTRSKPVEIDQLFYIDTLEDLMVKEHTRQLEQQQGNWIVPMSDLPHTLMRTLEIFPSSNTYQTYFESIPCDELESE